MIAYYYTITQPTQVIYLLAELPLQIRKKTNACGFAWGKLKCKSVQSDL